MLVGWLITESTKKNIIEYLFFILFKYNKYMLVLQPEIAVQLDRLSPGASFLRTQRQGKPPNLDRFRNT